MSSSTVAGNVSPATPGFCPAPPPPPPPPVPGQVPALRINTAENPGPRHKLQSNDPYEPPAAIQNAMLTKDKKPFTYTPGMGGKLDLSQIRSPRMAKRVAKNANDEGIEGPPKSALEPKPAPTQTGASVYIQPQVAVPVFPTNVPPQPVPNKTMVSPVPNKIVANPVPNKTVVNNVNCAPVPERQVEPPRNVIRVETKATPHSPPINQPETPTTPPQVTLAKAPTPWMLNRNKSQEELPEWAKRVNKSQESTPESPSSPPVYVQQIPTPPPRQPSPQPFVNQKPKQQQHIRQPAQPQEHVIPLRIEDRPSVFSVKHEPGHHQFKQPSPQHQQRWGQPVNQPRQNQTPIQVQIQSKPQPQPQQSGGYIIPVIIEGKEPKATVVIPSSSQTQTRIIPAENQTMKQNMQRNVPAQQAEPGPVQSRSFRVLQKITSTDIPDDVDGEQIRKLQLTEDDRSLMNRFKEQVDNDTYLHQEEDPRYRGAAIPSRAFRYLQNMTDAGEITTNTIPRTNNALHKRPNRNSKTYEDVQTNLPPSEQQVPEPKKYTGSAIPSRSFRILQAMTAPESIAIQENRQADFVCRTENSMPGNQQGIFFLPHWNPGSELWACYPVPPPPPPSCAYLEIPESSSTPSCAFYSYADRNVVYAYYPVYNQNCSTCRAPLVVEGQPGDHRAANVHPKFLQDQRVQDAVGLPSCRGSLRSESNRLDQFQGNPLCRDSALLSCPGTWRGNHSEVARVRGRDRIVVTPCSNAEVSDGSGSEAETSESAGGSSSESSSESGNDSDSYLAYSTGLNPCSSGTDVSSGNGDTCERSYTGSPRVQQNRADCTESGEEPLSQESDAAEETMTVSVSLPLKFRFSVTEDNEDVTTVIVGDSTVKPERASEVSVDFQLNSSDFAKKSTDESGEDLQVEFTIKTTTTQKGKDDEAEEDEEEEVSKKTPIKETGSVLSIPGKSPSVHNSREGTDDEDSGVTSDMSRIISEVDTDSECCVTKREINKYQRTQTHSRLFRLLNGSDPTSDRKRNRLSLPLDVQGGFGYDENCSSYSSGLTSPEYSPISEHSWRRLHEPGRTSATTDGEDAYYQTWKSGKNRASGAVGTSPRAMGGKRPQWAPKVSVLCPRIKSTKSVPQTLDSSCGKPLGLPILSLAQNPLRNNRC